MKSNFNGLKRSLSWAPAALAVAMVALPALAENGPCLQCNLLRASADAQQPLSGAGAGNLANVNLGLNVAGFLNRPGPRVLFPDAPVINPGLINWAPGQELPYSFTRPWEFAKTDFDPAFVTPFYSDTQGPLNVPSAPWNVFTGGGDVANRYYNNGMLRLGPNAQLSPKKLI